MKTEIEKITPEFMSYVLGWSCNRSAVMQSLLSSLIDNEIDCESIFDDVIGEICLVTLHEGDHVKNLDLIQSTIMEMKDCDGRPAFGRLVIKVNNYRVVNNATP